MVIFILTKKQCELIQLLAQSKEVMSSDHLSDRLGISAKTIRRYIDLINQHLLEYNAEIVSMRGYGYALQGNIRDIGDMITSLSSNDYDRRIKDIIVLLLAREYITAEEIGDELFYSTSMMNRLIPEVRKYLAVYHLNLLSKPYYGMSVDGSETDIRNLMIDCGFTKNRYGEISCYLKNINAQEFQAIKDLILIFLRRHKIVIADDDASDLIMRTVIIVSRCRQSHYLDTPEDMPDKNLLRLLLTEVSTICKLHIPPPEASYLSIYFDIINSRMQNELTVDQEEINRLVIQFLGKMQEIYSNLVVDDSVRESLTLHLNLMLNRINHKHYIKNGLLQDIKANYILEMNYAITFGKMIEEHFDITIPEDELGYLALYFALSKHKSQEVKRVIILCNYGVATSQLIREQIKERFPQLEVVGIYPLYYLEVVMTQDIDLIISTVDLEQCKVTKPLVVIKQFLDEDALKDIEKVFDTPQESTLLDYFEPDALFLLNTETKADTLAQMSERMLELEYFDQDTVDKIYEREEVSSTDIGNLIAIPHAIIETGRRSVIGIGILEKPIIWDREKVQIVFMIGMNFTDAQKNNVFRHLYRIIKDVSNVNYLISGRSFETFKKLFG